MRELWTISNDYWRFPISVDFPENQTDVAFVRIGFGLNLLQCQRKAVEEVLLTVAEKVGSGKYRVMTNDLKKIAQKSEETDPEKIVEWKPWPYNVRYRPYRKSEGVERGKARDEFFHEFCKTGWMMDPIQAEILWNAFARHAMHWVLNERKIVDFGFFHLVSLPYRPNWKEIVLAWASDNPKMPLEALLLRSELLMWVKLPKRVLWSLEVVPDGHWWKEAQRSEHDRVIIRAKDAKWRASLEQYITSLHNVIVRQMGHAKWVYKSFLSQIKRPFVVVTEERNDSGRITRKRGQWEPAMAPNHVNYAYDARGRKAVIPIRPGDPKEKVGDVPVVPPVQPETGDVRDTGQDVQG